MRIDQQEWIPTSSFLVTLAKRSDREFDAIVIDHGAEAGFTHVDVYMPILNTAVSSIATAGEHAVWDHVRVKWDRRVERWVVSP